MFPSHHRVRIAFGKPLLTSGRARAQLLSALRAPCPGFGLARDLAYRAGAEKSPLILRALSPCAIHPRPLCRAFRTGPRQYPESLFREPSAHRKECLIVAFPDDRLSKRQE